MLRISALVIIVFIYTSGCLSDDMSIVVSERNLTVINQTYINITNITKNVSITVNNSNLAGTLRIQGINYTTSINPIQIYVYTNASVQNQQFSISLFINNTRVQYHSMSRPSQPIGENVLTISAVIPANTMYKVQIVNYNTYFWYEYRYN